MQEGAFTITLGRKPVEIPPLTVAQIKQIGLAIPGVGNGFTELGFEAEMTILLAALSVAEPEITREALGRRRMTRREIGAAVRAILVGGEFIDPEAPNRGEAPPAESPAETDSAAKSG